MRPDESYHECNRGYLSLFPLLLSLVDPSSPHLGAILDLMSDPEHLWSPYGIRSLSLSHPEFGKGEDYWKGPIWMPMNYMALSALHGVRTSPLMSFASSNVPRIEVCCCRGTIPRASQEDIHRVADEYHRQCLQGVRTDRLCVGTIQRGDRGRSKESSIHGMDLTRDTE